MRVPDVRAQLATAAHYARLIAATFLALASARFAAGAVLFAVQTRAPGLPEVVGDDRKGAPAPTTAPDTPAGAGDRGVAVLQRGQSARTTLSISAGPPRSEVWVNGSKRGNTPFLGEVSCKVGAPIRIEVVPPRGAPLVYERECKPGNVVIDG